MKPTVGRMVHYYAYDQDGPYAAVVTDASWGDGKLSLAVFGFLKDEPVVMVRGVRERPLQIPLDDVQEFWAWPPRETE